MLLYYLHPQVTMKKNTKNLKTTKKNTNTKIKSGKERNNIKKSGTLRDNFEDFFYKNNGILFFVSLALTVIFGILLFNPKVSTGGDDSEYIIRALNFMRGEHFPTFQGSFYPIFLSFWIAILNMNLVQLIVFLKVISLLLIIGHLVFMYLSFKEHISPSTLGFVMVFISLNAYILYFGSQTYSEALFLFLQALAFYLLTQSLNLFQPDAESNLHIGKWFAFSFIMFLMIQTRNVGYAFLFSVLSYLLLHKKYRLILYALGSYISYALLFTLYKLVFWNIKPSDTGGRLELILLKNTYNPGEGTEDFAGMIVRFIDNAKIFLSKQMGVILGFSAETEAKNSGFFTVVMIILLVGFLIYAWQKSKSLKFVGLYLLFSLGITFITLQKQWGQLRLILVYVPLILLFIGGGMSLLAVKRYKILHYILLLFFVISIFKSLGVTLEKTSENSKILSKNLQGDRYYGFTPDWINYLQMCSWAGENLPEDALIACRKPSIASVYANGRKFHRINKVPSVPSKSTLENLKQEGRNYYIFKVGDLSGKNISPQLMFSIRRNLSAIVVIDRTPYWVCDFAGQEEPVTKVFGELGIAMEKDLQKFIIQKVNIAQSTYAYIPEDLLMALYDKKVGYVIQASLRLKPQVNDGRIITTVPFYLKYIEYKYPGIFIESQKIGAQESATLFTVNYKVYGIGN